MSVELLDILDMSQQPLYFLGIILYSYRKENQETFQPFIKGHLLRDFFLLKPARFKIYLDFLVVLLFGAFIALTVYNEYTCTLD